MSAISRSGLLFVAALVAAALYTLLLPWQPYPGSVVLKTSMCVLLAACAWQAKQKLLVAALLCSAAGDAFLGVYQGGANATPHINHICFGLRGFDPAATVAALEARGLPAEARARDGVTQVYTADPDNLRVQLQDVSFCGGVGPLGNECRA